MNPSKDKIKEGTGLNEFTIVDSTPNKQMSKWLIINCCVALLARMLQKHMWFQFLVGYPRTVLFLQSYEHMTLCLMHPKNLNNKRKSNGLFEHCAFRQLSMWVRATETQINKKDNIQSILSCYRISTTILPIVLSADH